MAQGEALLTRFCYTNTQGTFGILEVPGFQCYTVERPWLQNQRFVSCVPEGIYEIENHNSNKYPNTFALINKDEGISHYQESWSKRYAILIHWANHFADLNGCIGVGRDLSGWRVQKQKEGINRELWTITNSKKVIYPRLRKAFQENNITRLRITRGHPMGD